MTFLQRHIITTSFIVMGLAACETLPTSATTQNTAQTASVKTTATSYDLVNRSEVVATVKSKAVAVDLERQALEWGYTPVSYTHLTLPTICSV